MRILLCLAILSLLLSGCGVEKKNEKKVKEHPVSEAIPENLGDPNAPTEIRVLQGAKEDRDKINAQRKEDSKVLKESD
jgi:hypothetical protein